LGLLEGIILPEFHPGLGEEFNPSTSSGLNKTLTNGGV